MALIEYLSPFYGLERPEARALRTRVYREKRRKETPRRTWKAKSPDISIIPIPTPYLFCNHKYQGQGLLSVKSVFSKKKKPNVKASCFLQGAFPIKSRKLTFIQL